MAPPGDRPAVSVCLLDHRTLVLARPPAEDRPGECAQAQGPQRCGPADGRRGAIAPGLADQYAIHKGWSCRLHYDNLIALAAGKPELGPIPSYSTLRRFMLAQGWCADRAAPAATPTARDGREPSRPARSAQLGDGVRPWPVAPRLPSRLAQDPRSSGQWITPLALGIMDDRSRLACHVQWYRSETADDLIHGLCQAFQKRGLPRSLLTDNGSAMIAGETVQGLAALGHCPPHNAAIFPLSKC